MNPIQAVYDSPRQKYVEWYLTSTKLGQLQLKHLKRRITQARLQANGVPRAKARELIRRGYQNS